MLHYKIRRCIELIDELLLSDAISTTDKEKLVKLKEEIFSINDDIIKLKVEVWEVRECLERVAKVLELDLSQYIKRAMPRTVQAVVEHH